jgi:hypothetical protein
MIANLVPLPGNKPCKGGVHAHRLGDFRHTGRSAMRRWIDKLSFGMRVVLTTLITATTVAVLVWDVIEMPF